MTGNHFIDSLPHSERELLIDELKPISLQQSAVLIEQMHPVEVITFPVTCQLDNVLLRPDGSAVETAIIGREGISGLLPFIAGTPSAWRTTVRISGDAWQMPSSILTGLFETRPILRTELLRLGYFYQVQATYNAACAATHDVPSRVARWVLTAFDHDGGEELRITQEEIATLLAVQRTSIVEAFARMTGAGAIRHVRGRLRLKSRKAAEPLACSCYGELRAWRSWVTTPGAVATEDTALSKARIRPATASRV